MDLPTPIKAPYSFSLGEEDAHLTLSAGGNLGIGVLPMEWGRQDFDVEIGEDLDSMANAITEQVTQQIAVQMEMLEQQIETQLANLPNLIGTSGLSPEEAERINQRARQASERAAAHAQEKMQHAQERLQRKLESARRRAEMKARAAERVARDRRRRPEANTWSPPQPEPPSQPVSDEERLMVLQMLEQQQITLEQAEQLLAALEGR
jgi:paraquat-inducible protein B